MEANFAPSKLTVISCKSKNIIYLNEPSTNLPRKNTPLWQIMKQHVYKWVHVEIQQIGFHFITHLQQGFVSEVSPILIWH